MAWHAGPRVLRLFSGVIASTAVARHLGPVEFGVLSFATMVASLFGILAQMGSLDVVIRNAATFPGQIPSMIQAAFKIRLAGALLAGVGILIIPLWLGHRSVYWILAVLPLTLVPDCIEAAFYGRGQFQAMAPLRAVSATLGLAVRLAMVARQAPIEAFAAITVFEGVITGVLLLCSRPWLSVPATNREIYSARNLLQQSFPLMASGIIVAVMLKLDQFMLQTFRPGEDVGHYYVVVRLFETAGILIPSIVAVLLPGLAQLYGSSEAEYRSKMVVIYRRTYQVGLAGAVLACLLAPLVIPSLFGSEYKASVPIFMAYAFSFPSFAVGSIRAMEFVISNKNQNHLLVSLVLLPFQIILCMAGIFWHGPVGLAAAMALVAFVSTTLLSFALPPLKENWSLQKEALSSIWK